MSPVGRFLECRDCLLTFSFPLGEHYDAVVRQFEAQSCRSSIPVSLFLPDELEIEDCAGNGAERRHLVVQRFEGQVPMIASCTKCKNKFFTPTALAHDAMAQSGTCFTSTICIGATNEW